MGEDVALVTAELLAALDAAGLVIVPKEPTPEMIEEAWASALAEKAADVWRDMVSAAPHPLSKANSA